MKYSSAKLPTMTPQRQEIKFDENLHKEYELEGNMIDAFKATSKIYHLGLTDTVTQNREVEKTITAFENNQDNPEEMRLKVVTPREAADNGIEGMKDNISVFALEEYKKLKEKREKWGEEAGKYLFQLDKPWLIPAAALGGMWGTVRDIPVTAADLMVTAGLGKIVKGAKTANVYYNARKLMRARKIKSANLKIKSAVATNRERWAARLNKMANQLKPIPVGLKKVGAATKKDFVPAVGGAIIVNTLEEAAVHQLSKAKGYNYDIKEPLAMGLFFPVAAKVFAGGLSAVFKTEGRPVAKPRGAPVAKPQGTPNLPALRPSGDIRAVKADIVERANTPAEAVTLAKRSGLKGDEIGPLEAMAAVENKLGPEALKFILEIGAAMQRQGVEMDIVEMFPMLRNIAEFDKAYDEFMSQRYGAGHEKVIATAEDAEEFFKFTDGHIKGYIENNKLPDPVSPARAAQQEVKAIDAEIEELTAVEKSIDNIKELEELRGFEKQFKEAVDLQKEAQGTAMLREKRSEINGDIKATKHALELGKRNNDAKDIATFTKELEELEAQKVDINKKIKEAHKKFKEVTGNPKLKLTEIATLDLTSSVKGLDPVPVKEKTFDSFGREEGTAAFQKLYRIQDRIKELEGKPEKAEASATEIALRGEMQQIDPETGLTKGDMYEQRSAIEMGLRKPKTEYEHKIQRQKEDALDSMLGLSKADDISKADNPLGEFETMYRTGDTESMDTVKYVMNRVHKNINDAKQLEAPKKVIKEKIKELKEVRKAAAEVEDIPAPHKEISKIDESLEKIYARSGADDGTVNYVKEVGEKVDDFLNCMKGKKKGD